MFVYNIYLLNAKTVIFTAIGFAHSFRCSSFFFFLFSSFNNNNNNDDREHYSENFKNKINAFFFHLCFNAPGILQSTKKEIIRTHFFFCYSTIIPKPKKKIK